MSLFFLFVDPVHPDICNCPKFDVRSWHLKAQCHYENIPAQIKNDLLPFPVKSVDFEDVLAQVKEEFGAHAGSYSFCHYAIKDNQVSV